MEALREIRTAYLAVETAIIELRNADVAPKNVIGKLYEIKQVLHEAGYPEEYDAY